MHEIICPHCSKAFTFDEAGYANILKELRDGDFDKQLHERLELAEREKQGAIALAEAKVTNALQAAAARKDAEVQTLQAQLAAAEVARKLAVTEALAAVSKERDGLANALERERNAQYLVCTAHPDEDGAGRPCSGGVLACLLALCRARAQDQHHPAGALWH